MTKSNLIFDICTLINPVGQIVSHQGVHLIVVVMQINTGIGKRLNEVTILYSCGTLSFQFHDMIPEE